MEPMIRGYSVQQQLNFLETQYTPEISERLLSKIPEDIRLGLQDLKPAEWYPRRYSVAVLDAIVSHQDGDNDAAMEELQRCGTFIATEATNTFLKLLMKILTPKLFFKKLPEFWSRDQKGGHISVDTSEASEGRISLVIEDVEGFHHIGIISLGWMFFAMKSMGKTEVKVEQTGWSLATPGPKEISYQVTWAL